MSQTLAADAMRPTRADARAKATKPTRVRSERAAAITVGVLYIVATAAPIAAAAAGAPSAMADLATHETEVLVMILLGIVMAVTVAGIACMFYPILRQDADTPGKQGLAVWYVGTRVTEGALFFVWILALLAMLTVSEQMRSGAVAQAASLQAVGVALKAMSDYSLILGQTVFCVGAAMLYWLLYVSRRVPRWLAVWGLIAAPMMLVAGLTLPFTHDPNSMVSSLLYAPMGLQEMVLAVWLIARGFRPSMGTPFPEVPGKEGSAS